MNATPEFLLSVSPTVVYTADAEGDYAATFVTDNVTRQLGWSPRDFLDQPNFWADHIYSDDRARVLADIARQSEAGEWLLEYRLQHRDGGYRWIRDQGRVLRDAQGRPQQIVGSWTDITERKQTEQELRRYAERLKTLREIDVAILAAMSPQAVADAAIGHIQKLVPCQRASVTLFDLAKGRAELLAVRGKEDLGIGAGFEVPLDSFGDLASLQQGKPCVVEDLLTLAQPSSRIGKLCAAGLRSLISVPMLAEGELLGTLDLWADSPRSLTLEHSDIAREVANQIAVAIRNAQTSKDASAGRARLKTLSQHLLEAQESERRRIAGELHDEIGQALSVIKTRLQVMAQAPKSARLPADLKECIGIVDEAVELVRNLAMDLRPAVLDDLGLVPAVRWLVHRQARDSGLAVRFCVEPPDLKLPPDLETVCFRVIQHAVTNVMRHAQAKCLEIALWRHNGQLEVRVDDDGAGFDVAAARAASLAGLSFGLLGMEERVSLAGGRVEIHSTPGQGSRLRAYLPVREASGAERERRAS
jgi:PAS domain S-box-containing protein